ncbi:hypothetical protein HRI_005281500 [Hibiscus trionum]|uniref:Protein kinase domain-containing protein n=1 Tax=Hibiscus trionum TaxID=183268 RepID=A0A9W7JM72_HIBTR|nr:hypothetical protein HRI_005281500 [Hibiscus trionum]
MRNSLQPILCFCQAFKRKLNRSKHPNSSGKLASSSLPEHLYRRFSLYEIRAATNNFDSDLVLGKGGTAVVYKGFFDDGASVLSVKRLMLGSSRHKILEDFRNEVELLCQLRHEHLVSLIGFCDEEGENIIVLSYMNRGSLFHHLHGTHHDPLTWKKRLEICVGVARGLHYLHAGAKRAVIHRDIKTRNILLDDQKVAVLADFTLSKTGPFSLSNAPIRIELPPLNKIETETSRTRLFGTLGYLAPELFFEATLVTDKSDVYSFGVVLFEVLSGRKAIKFDAGNDDHRHMIPWANEHIKNGTFYQIIDPYLKGKIAPSCLEKFLEIALSCVHVREHKRPALGEVEATLELALELQNRADSEMECLNPHGEVMYEEVVVSASAFNFLDYEADVFWPHGSSRLDSFIVEDSFSGKTEDTLSDIEGFYT